MTDKLRVIDFKEKKFTCGGRTFYLQDSLSFNRFRELGRLGIEFGFGYSFSDYFKATSRMVEYLNKMNIVELATELHNIQMGIIKLAEKDVPALRLCAIFINEAGEDTSEYDEVKIKEKIDCWGRELDVTPFFHLAANLVEDWMPAYELIIRNTSNQEKAKE